MPDEHCSMGSLFCDRPQCLEERKLRIRESEMPDKAIKQLAEMIMTRIRQPGYADDAADLTAALKAAIREEISSVCAYAIDGVHDLCITTERLDNTIKYLEQKVEALEKRMGEVETRMNSMKEALLP